jgi:predicted TIM-barrel enzyme
MMRLDRRGAGISRAAELTAVDQAVGVLMEEFGVSAGQAREFLQASAGVCGRPVELVAEVFVHQVWTGDDTYCDRNVARTLERALRDLPRTCSADAADARLAGKASGGDQVGSDLA